MEIRDSLDAGLDLLDRHVVDAEGASLGKVDDLRFGTAHGRAPELVALMLGQQAYGRRIGGRVGRWWTAVAARLSARPEAVEVPMELVEAVGVTVRLRVTADALPDLGRAERWLRDGFIVKVPGAYHESD